MDYLKAKTAWNQAKEYKKLQAQHENKLKQQFQSRLLDESIALEDAELTELEEIEVIDAVVAKLGISDIQKI